MKKYDGGKHGDPMVYGVRLTQTGAKLVHFTGTGWQYQLGHDLDVDGAPSAFDAAEALWLEGAHPESKLLVWEGTDPTRGRAMMLGTAVLTIAVGIIRYDDPDDAEDEPVPGKLAVAA